MINEMEISQILSNDEVKIFKRISLRLKRIRWMMPQFHFFEILMQTMEFDFCFTCNRVFHMHLSFD